jgi:hypothetical protein
VRISVSVVFTLIMFCATPAVPQMQSLGPTDTFAAAKLSPKEIRQVLDAVEKSAYDTPDSWTKELRARKVNLGSSTGLVVQGTSLLCGGTGNCQTWCFRKANNTWVSILAGDHAPMASGFQLGPGVTHGVKDFTIVSHLSAEREDRVVFNFDGTVYRAK